jgi:hypothetical protein
MHSRKSGEIPLVLTRVPQIQLEILQNFCALENASGFYSSNKAPSQYRTCLKSKGVQETFFMSRVDLEKVMSKHQLILCSRENEWAEYLKTVSTLTVVVHEAANNEETCMVDSG